MPEENIKPGQHPSFFSLMIWAVRLCKPYRKWVAIILFAMLIEAVMSVATPWPLKIIIDDVVGHGTLPHEPSLAELHVSIKQ